MKIKEIQILIPGGGFYGGIESLHQLAHLINKIKYPVSVVYVPKYQNFSKTNFILNKNLKNYKIRIKNKIIDNKNVLVIVPETFTGYLSKIYNAKKCIYWLSIDNYLFKKKKDASILNIFINFISSIKFLSKYLSLDLYLPQLTYDRIKRDKIFNLCQSRYAFDYLKKNNMKNLNMIIDYIPIRNFKKYKKKIDIILNSNKGYQFNELFKKQYNNILNIQYLKNLNLVQTQKVIAKSKLFIDFGNHPGRDRIPRETVIQKTNLFVMNRGSANYYQDVPISKYYKFDNYNDLTSFKIIKSLLLNKNFIHKNYRKKIYNDKKLMLHQIKRFLEKL